MRACPASPKPDAGTFRPRPPGPGPRARPPSGSRVQPCSKSNLSLLEWAFSQCRRNNSQSLQARCGHTYPARRERCQHGCPEPARQRHSKVGERRDDAVRHRESPREWHGQALRSDTPARRRGRDARSACAHGGRGRPRACCRRGLLWTREQPEHADGGRDAHAHRRGATCRRRCRSSRCCACEQRARGGVRQRPEGHPRPQARAVGPARMRRPLSGARACTSVRRGTGRRAAVGLGSPEGAGCTRGGAGTSVAGQRSAACPPVCCGAAKLPPIAFGPLRADAFYGLG